uniref:NCK associated protein 5 n=1 Tax=Oryzias melastigma TaxID=30732 RepID=A0A3B3C0A5_ORYME
MHRREKLIHELEEERRLRLESEKRLREVTEESELGRAQMVSLQQQFSSNSAVEAAVPSAPGFPSFTAPPALFPSVVFLSLFLAPLTSSLLSLNQDKLSEEVQKLQVGLEATRAEPADAELDGSQADEDRDRTKLLLERLKTLEVENSALALENESQREQYERCLDEVANQVVQALLTQKDLREECLKLRTRVFDLEQQNRALSVLFQQKIKPASDLLLQSSLTWEKRLSLGSSAPSNICAPLEEQPPTRRKESHILEGLRKLQRRKNRSSSCSSRVSKSGYKDCMNSNEGIYSLGIKGSSKGVSKPVHVSRASGALGRRFSYDSDDADDELARSSCRDNIPTKDGWIHCKKLSHSISDSLCSLEGTQDAMGDGTSCPIASKPYDSKERPEKLMSFINSFLPLEGRKSAFSRPATQHRNPAPVEGPSCLSDPDDPEETIPGSGGVKAPCSQPQELAERDIKRLSRDTIKIFKQQYMQKDQGRTQSADGRPKPFSLLKEPKATKCTQSEESVLTVFDAEGEPIDLCAQRLVSGAEGCKATEIQKRPTRQNSANTTNYSVLESPEKPSEHQSRSGKGNNSREGSAERLQLAPQRKLIKPPSSRTNKGFSVPPMSDVNSPKSGGSKIPGVNKPSASPLRVSKGTTTEPSVSGNSGPSTQEKSPSSLTVKMSRFIKTQGTSTQSPKAVNCKVPGQADLSKSSSSTSPHLPKRRLDFSDSSEQPTRDKHCETSKNKLRSPSPPPPPGRTTSLLVRPNYEGSPQAHKSGAAQPSTPTTVRGPPPSYHTSVAPNMQATLPIKDKDCLDVDRIKDYLPPASSGCARVPEIAPKNSKNVPPPYSALRVSSLQNSFANKRTPAQENSHQTVQKTSISLPISLQESAQCPTEPQKAVISPPGPAVLSPNLSEKASKTRIPMGFKAFLKSPPSHKSSPTIPGKQEKDHINSVSKETVTSNASTQCDGSQAVYSIDSTPTMSVPEGKGEVLCQPQEEDLQPPVLSVEGNVSDKAKRSSQLFGRSISINTKPHLKPALGMNGAKARSQSFSTNYIEKPNINGLEGPGRIRTQIITNSGERGNSLSRQGSSETTGVGLAESPIHSPRTRLSHHGGMMGPNSQSGLPEKTLQSCVKGEGPTGGVKGDGVTSPSQKEARTLSKSDRTAFNNVQKPAKVASHPQFQPPSAFVFSPESPTREADAIATSPAEPDKTQLGSPSKFPDTEEKKISPTTCTIEEKVMMGIEENLQKSQEQEKAAANEAKQKTGPSLANWFGLRKSKLPALSGKKADSPKAREEKKELKIGSVLGGKQIKSDKKKEKKKDGQEVQNLSEMNNKLSSIMDHCNNQMGQITLILTQKISLKAKSEEGNIPDTSCQDHMIGSSCQMRTLDSGIGTFPLPDSVTRASGRHIPKSESSPDGVIAGSTERSRDAPSSHPDPSQSDSKVPSPSKAHVHTPTTSMGHSLSDPTVTCSRNAPDTQSRLPKLASTGYDVKHTNFSPGVVIHSSVPIYERLGAETEFLWLLSTPTFSPSNREDLVEDWMVPENHLPEIPVSPNQPASLDVSLESLSKMTHPAETGKTAESCCKVSRSSCASSFMGRPGADPAGSLSDSLYDSFSSCTSQGSNDV